MNLDFIGYGISEVLEFLVCGSGGDEEAVLVAKQLLVANARCILRLVAKV